VRGCAVAQHRVEAAIHFAVSIVVPESVCDPLTYYRNNTVNSRALIEAIVHSGGASLHLFVNCCRIRQP
jgi:UDP-glucose 4-epimerase